MKHLNQEQRYNISAMRNAGFNQKQIAAELEVSPSTISRELSRNKTKRGGYSPKLAQEIYQIRKERFGLKRKLTPYIRGLIERSLIEEQWSCEQIVGHYRNEGIAMVCVETIYSMIREDKEQGGSLYKHLRHKKRRKKGKKGKKVIIKDRVSISDRPPEVAEKTRFGDWEMDLIVGKGNKGAILVLVERTTKFMIMTKLKHGKKSKELAKEVCNLLLPYKDYVHTITTDNGTEFASHKYICKKLECVVYFADPYSSWQKGLVENTNKLIRQYIPKKLSFTYISQQKIKEIQYKLNKRPRKTMNYKTPLSNFFSNIA